MYRRTIYIWIHQRQKLNFYYTQIRGVNMAQIGFVHYKHFPCGPLMLKTLFTFCFWVTLRRRFHEADVENRSSLELGAASPHFQSIVLRAGLILKSFLLQLWVWFVVLALFLCAIYGERMTVFRIIYMTLCLVFLITFQVWEIRFFILSSSF